MSDIHHRTIAELHRNDGERIANAAFIVEAVNSHYQLKADQRARKALEQIAGWKNDTLGPRPKEFGPFDCDPSISSAFDRGVRMAFYRCADHAIAALAEIAH